MRVSNFNNICVTDILYMFQKSILFLTDRPASLEEEKFRLILTSYRTKYPTYALGCVRLQSFQFDNNGKIVVISCIYSLKNAH